MAAETLREHSERWFQLARPTLRWNTVQSYEVALRRRILPALGDTPLDALNRRQVKEWFVEMLGHRAVGTSLHALAVLNIILESAVEDESLPTNPARALRKSLRALLRDHKAHQREPMSRADLLAFLEAARECPDTYTGLLLLAFTGMRLGEALALQWPDVDLAGKAIRVERQALPNGRIAPLKSASSRRSIPVHERLVNTLWRIRTEREIAAHDIGLPPFVVFPYLGTEPTVATARRVMAKAVKRACRKAGISPKHSPHTLRHTYGTQLFEHGAHPKLVQQLLGHATLAETDRYTRHARITDLTALEKMSEGLDGGEKS